MKRRHLLRSSLLLASASLPEWGGAADDGAIPLGPNADLGGRLLLPSGDEWNREVSGDPVDPRSDAIIAAIGADTRIHEDFGGVWKGVPAGIPYVVVDASRPRAPV